MLELRSLLLLQRVEDDITQTFVLIYTSQNVKKINFNTNSTGVHTNPK
jgi:hypothetical protein